MGKNARSNFENYSKKLRKSWKTGKMAVFRFHGNHKKTLRTTCHFYFLNQFLTFLPLIWYQIHATSWSRLARKRPPPSWNLRKIALYPLRMSCAVKLAPCVPLITDHFRILCSKFHKFAILKEFWVSFHFNFRHFYHFYTILGLFLAKIVIFHEKSNFLKIGHFTQNTSQPP